MTPESKNESILLQAKEEEVQVTKEQLDEFMLVLCPIFMDKHVEEVPFDKVLAIVASKTNFEEALIMACIAKMTDNN